ncbi:divergent polysaccharide deacetylase family protein [Rossellomorea aquimaris]|uniref:divergent polysaccharide deacetylase family protein n=1 Tax=Rossellomorea TaxID=2837508 RepID=UPI001CD2629D|nr:divergent polysaccharide deacetylase family protein [Rossellomorea aquimaris]MCA1061502.1 divergent polysaccharide deacetylase family protein [Rossellomorea aquimaris]
MRILLIFFLLTFSVQTSVSARNILPYPAHHNELAIVIDDLGNGMKGTKEILNLPVTLTIAVMPFLPTTRKDAEKAHENGHEVIIHLPMEPMHGKASWLGPGAITTSLSDEEIRKRVEQAIKEVPYAVGINHHMGSKATADERVMRIVLDICKENGLFYLDSKTTGKSVIPQLAKELGVPYLENELFFDDVYTIQHIGKQARLLSKELDHDNATIAIGHVGVTGMKVATMLKEFLPLYEKKATIVPLSDLIPEYHLIDESMP